MARKKQDLRKQLNNDAFLLESATQLVIGRQLLRHVKHTVLKRLKELSPTADHADVFKWIMQRVKEATTDPIDRRTLINQIEKQTLPYLDEQASLKRTDEVNARRIDMIRRLYERLTSLVYVGFKPTEKGHFGYMSRKSPILLHGSKHLMIYMLDYIWHRSRTFGSVNSHEPQRILRLGSNANMYVPDNVEDCTHECIIGADAINVMKSKIRIKKLFDRAYIELHGKPDLVIVDDLSMLKLSKDTSKQATYNTEVLTSFVQYSINHGFALVAGLVGKCNIVVRPPEILIRELKLATDNATMLIGDVDNKVLPERVIARMMKKENEPTGTD